MLRCQEKQCPLGEVYGLPEDISVASQPGSLVVCQCDTHPEMEQDPPHPTPPHTHTLPVSTYTASSKTIKDYHH